MSTWIIVRKSDLAVLGSYVSDAKKDTIADFDAQSAEPISKHLALPNGMFADAVRCEMDGDEMTIVADAAKLQDHRDAKLNEIRAMRDERMKAVDIIVNELVVGDRSDNAAVKVFRQALLDITIPYKKVDGHAKAMIDGVDLNEDINWPDEP